MDASRSSSKCARTWRSTRPIARGSSPCWQSTLALAEPRQQLGEVAGASAAVELGGEDPVPGVATGRCGARQREQIRALGDAGSGTRLDGGGADVRVAELPK